MRRRLIYGPPVVIGIAGASASGKSKLAHSMVRAIGLDWVSHIDMDGYHLHARLERMAMNEVPDQPRANDFKLFIEHLDALRAGKSIQMPLYNHTAGKLGGHSLRNPRPIILAEGLHAGLVNSLGKRNVVDILVYLDPEEDLRRAWKIARDVKDRSYSYEQAVQQVETRLPYERKHIHPQRDKADLVVAIRSEGPGRQCHQVILSDTFLNHNIGGNNLRDILGTECTMRQIEDKGRIAYEPSISAQLTKIGADLEGAGFDRLLDLLGTQTQFGSYKDMLRILSTIAAVFAIQMAGD